jgi:tetratricopeptide (TPR) repeat protein
VHAAHAVGIVHRDLKPGNILLTADRTPKISDFGLARHFGQDQDLTLSGARVGTPSYMSPEQAAGRAGAVEPASDIYSLGAILYELLTGRPPFRGETSAATVLQVLHQEPVAPSRLNGRVPRDLETICLKCLQKDPRRRYATASALADDLRRFRAGEPILARPVGRPERAIKWVRRRPGAAAATAAGVLLAAALTALTVSWAVRRATAARMVDAYLEQVAERERASDWAAARAAVWRAKAWSEDRGPPPVRQRVRDAERELDFVDTLSRIRSDRAFAIHPQFNPPDVDRQYQDAFRNAGIGTIDEPAATVAARIKASPARAAIVAALDDWAFCFGSAPRRLWLLEVARDADPDPWRDRVRDPRNWQNPDVLNQLASSARLRKESVSLLLVLGGLLDFNRVDAIPFHRWIQAAHPDDFWANFVLAEFLDEHHDDDAVNFYRAALALRPNSAAANVNLAMSLQERGRNDEAADYWIRALDLAPNAPMVHYNVAIALLNDGQTDAAIRELRQTLKLDPQFPPAHAALGHALLVQGRVVEAKSELRRALELLPPTHLLRAQVNKDLSETTVADNGPGHGGHD